MQVPVSLNGVESTLLDPRNTWNDTVSAYKFIFGSLVSDSVSNYVLFLLFQAAYDAAAAKLASMFIKNYEQYITPGNTDFSTYGPKLSN